MEKYLNMMTLINPQKLINKTNYQVSSIKIKELYSDYYPVTKSEKILSFKNISGIFKSNNKKISEILSP